MFRLCTKQAPVATRVLRGRRTTALQHQPLVTQGGGGGVVAYYFLKPGIVDTCGLSQSSDCSAVIILEQLESQSITSAVIFTMSQASGGLSNSYRRAHAPILPLFIHGVTPDNGFLHSLSVTGAMPDSTGRIPKAVPRTVGVRFTQTDGLLRGRHTTNGACLWRCSYRASSLGVNDGPWRCRINWPTNNVPHSSLD